MPANKHYDKGDDDMGTDPYSPLAPARVRVLVLPCGKVTNRRFKAFVDRLQRVPSVRLGDVTTGKWTSGESFSPLSFPDGRVHLDISCASVPSSYGQLTPFEPFRGTMVIIGTVDARAYDSTPAHEEQPEEDGSRNVFYRRAHDGFISAMENAQDQYTGALLTQLVIMDSESRDQKPWIPAEALHLPPEDDMGATSTMAIMTQIVERLLHEMAGLAEQMRSWATISMQLMDSRQSNRPEVDRKPSVRLSDHSQISRDGSASSDRIPRSHSRHLSQAFRSPSPTSVADSPRPDSPTSRSETPSSPDRSSTVESPVEDNKQRQRFSRNALSTPLNGTNPDKERNIGKNRVGIMLGTLHMMAGQWSVAWRELIEHTNKARSLHDYIWLAVGIERLTVCMLLLGAEGFPFQIPSVCLLGSERSSSIPFIDSGRDSSNNVGAKEPENAKVSLRKLGTSLGDICSTVLIYYDRASTYGMEYMPPLAFSELILRLTKLQSIPLEGMDCLASDPIFGQGQLAPLCRPSEAKGPAEASRLAICEMLFRAYPGPDSELDVASRSSILAGLVSILSSLKLERKRAIVLKELINVLTPPLQQARKLGAAEFGIHPSNSLSYASSIVLSSEQNGTAQSFQSILAQLQSAYAVSEGHSATASSQLEASEPDFERILDDITQPLARLANLDHLGSLNLKFDILRTSIDFCESLPDLAGAAYNAALLLSISGPQRPIDPTRRERRVTLAAEEQVRLANVIAMVAGTAREDGARVDLPPFWDRFLVRSVQLVESDATGKLTEHRKADMNADGAKSLFLYDPFAKKAETGHKENIVVAGERTSFAVVLQNPYDFETVVERMSFVMEEGDLVVEPVRVVLGPRRLQEVVVAATPMRPGTLKIRACRVKMAGCRDDLFTIHNDEWRAEMHVKVKEAVKARAVSTAIDRALAGQGQNLPQPSSVELVAIPAQPVVVVEAVGLKNQSLMLLEGERATFRITIRNASKNADVDFLHVSFEDSLTNNLRTALTSKTISRAELYEIEWEMTQNPIFTWKRLDSETQELIQAGSCAEFEIGVLGRAGIRDARVFFDFAHLGSEGEASTFYTRQLAVDVNISVNTCIEIQHFDVLRLPRALGDATDDAAGKLGQCLVVLDVRNVWAKPIDVDLQFRQCAGTLLEGTQKKTVLPMQTVRFALPMQRLYVKKQHAQIPWISSQSRRQFVVSSTGDAGQQRSMREQFWYREELFKSVTGSWEESISGRKGSINLRGITLNQQQLAGLRSEDLDILCSIGTDKGDSTMVKRTGGSSFEVRARSFLQFKVQLANRSDKCIHAMLRMLPMVANQSTEAGPALDTTMASRNRLVWSGVLQQPVAVIEAGDSRTVELGFCAVAGGMYSVGVVVEEVRAAREEPGGTHDDDEIDEAVRQTAERRVWRAPELCSIRAI